MKNFEFKLTLSGWGDTPEEAWENVQDNFYPEKEPMPDEYDVIDERDDEEE